MALWQAAHGRLAKRRAATGLLGGAREQRATSRSSSASAPTQPPLTQCRSQPGLASAASLTGRLAFRFDSEILGGRVHRRPSRPARRGRELSGSVLVARIPPTRAQVPSCCTLPLHWQRLQETQKRHRATHGNPRKDVINSHPTQATKLSKTYRQAPATVLVGICPIRKNNVWKHLWLYRSISVNLVANSRLGIVKYNPRNIRSESGATRSLRTLWVPEEPTRILLQFATSTCSLSESRRRDDTAAA